MRNNNQYYVYILTNRSNKVLYIGVTNDLVRRIFEHKNKLAEGFSKKYNLTKLVYYETTMDVESAISKEKQLKNWHRDWKINLINRVNPEWRDLGEDIGVCKLKPEIPKQVRDDTSGVRDDTSGVRDDTSGVRDDTSGVRDAMINQMHFRSNKGITLIELVITMVLMGIVALVVANALSTATTAFFTTDNRKEALDQGRIAMDRMAKEIRNVNNNLAASVPASNATQFCFIDTEGVTIDYSYSNPNITRDTGNCAAGGGATLSTNIDSFLFEYIRANGNVDAAYAAGTTKLIRITLTAKISGESITLQTEVWPRNL
jgi:putative endonuclease